MTPFNKRKNLDTHFSSAFCKRPVAVVAIQFARMKRIGFGCFVADENVEPAVVVKVKPDRGLSGMKAKETGFLCDIVERAVTIIAQE